MTSDTARALVVDASVAIAIAVQEPGYDLAVSILRDRGAAGEKLIVPAFFWLELVNVLIKRHRLAPGVVLEALVDLENLGLESVELERPQLLLTIDAMGRGGLSAYDAAYLALAESADAELLTFDRHLAAAAGNRALPLGGGHAVEEARESYGPSWAAWPGAAVYLQKLRAQVAAQANG
ncbi:MAG TPA: type II toxin-antitoxin system VapC family toxin [Candidatus Limnocylindria bacterium]|jgi:predicted nucleic acid-binding protein